MKNQFIVNKELYNKAKEKLLELTTGRNSEKFDEWFKKEYPGLYAEYNLREFYEAFEHFERIRPSK